jgi:hypothetical protein
MVAKFPKFSQGLAQDPTTKRIWFGIATAHDFESHDGMTEETLYQKIFASHFGQLAIIFLWTSGNLFHVAWQGNFQAWVKDPLHIRPIAQFGIHTSDNLLLRLLHEVAQLDLLISHIQAYTSGGILLVCVVI